jgi:hypothetical protein
LGCAGECYQKLFLNIRDYADKCEMKCGSYDFTHYSFMFTAFVMCQVRGHTRH